ncbi:PP2C family protein-serine/threonine phosphatase [Streptomyces radicis]|uniref:Serine/threonine-protein phosphatase n=1 Tax=Streptomyces radicis TaxID=1750517 RepID=A0A3A9WDR2_9ACTN|nr:PP2C family protein-serine/threonine phosphatase [Streptomyces radicis]RKN11471.1 serine/threonine-protein phosphatase [Streptomyces radicis]RKN26510.1 serine/threonine-protein phosphatase [Streptomyces radicis]
MRSQPLSAPGLVPRWLRVLPPVVLVLVGVAQWLAPGWVQLAFLFAALPPLTGLIYGPLWTAAISGGVLGLMILPLTRPPHVSDADLGAVLAIAAFSVVVSWIRTRYTRDLVVVRDVAEAAQRAVLPPLPERVGDVRCAGLYRAAQVGALVGGDLFDVRAGPHGVRALVADVQGHGLAAVGAVAALLGAFREAVLDEEELRGVAARLDRRLVVDADEQSELFATALLVEFAGDGREARLISCGHPPPLLVRGGAASELHPEAGTPLGLGRGVAHPGPPAPTVVALDEGDVLLGYTDGVTEARDADGAFYPLVERVCARVSSERADEGEAPPRLVDFVWNDVNEFAARIEDDVALLALSPLS